MKCCQNCGTQNEDEAKFCINCGTEFKNANDENNVLDEENSNVETVETIYYDEERKIIENKSNLGKVSMIIGIIAISLSVICCCCFLPIGVVLGPIALVLGIISLVKYPNDKKGMAIAGIVLGAIALILGISIIVMEPALNDLLKDYVQEICKNAPDSDECQTFKEAFPDWFTE